MGRVDPRRRRPRRRSRPPHNPHVTTQRACCTYGSDTGGSRNLPARRLVSHRRNDRVGAHSLPDVVAARAIPRGSCVGTGPGTCDECHPRCPCGHPRTRRSSSHCRVLRSSRQPTARRGSSGRHRRTGAPPRSQRGLGRTRRRGPLLLRPLDPAREPHSADVALAKTRPRSPTRGPAARAHLRDDPDPPIGLGGIGIHKRHCTCLHAGSLLVRLPGHARRATIDASDGRLRSSGRERGRPRWVRPHA